MAPFSDEYLYGEIANKVFFWLLDQWRLGSVSYGFCIFSGIEMDNDSVFSNVRSL